MYHEIHDGTVTVELRKDQCAMLAYALGAMSDKDAKDTMGGDLAPALKDAMATVFSDLSFELRVAI